MKRYTRQRDAVLSTLLASDRSMTPPDILAAALPAVPSLSLSTVYRQLRDLLDGGDVVQVDLPGLPARFEAQCRVAQQESGHHHHHFHCTGCDQVFPIHACPGPMDALAPAGFRVERHDLTLHGRCADCVAD